MNISGRNKSVSNSNNYFLSVVLTVLFIIVFFEVTPETTFWSIPIKPEDDHMVGVFGLGDYSLSLIQKQCEYKKQFCLRKRILIVDDELDITFTFKMILEENGFNKQVDTYNEPLLALQNFKRVYRLLIIDIAMPVMDGFRLYQQIKEIDNKPKVLFVSAYLNHDVLRGYFPNKDENNKIDKILEDNGGRFMRKPVDSDELVRRVKSEICCHRIME